MPAIPESAFPRVLNGQGKRAVDVGRQMQELQKQQGRVLVTGIEPADYAEIRKIVPGVQYHAGAKTLKLDPGDSTKLPGSIGIVSDMSVPSTAVEEVKAIAEYLGCYAFQIEPVTVTHLTDVMQQMKSPL